MAYVYRHIRLDTNEVFYIGIGSDEAFERAYENNKGRRSDWWFKVVSKTEYRVDILFENLSVEAAKQKEIEFINLYGRRDLGSGTLVNMTDGGDGLQNRVFTPEYRMKLSIAAKARKLSDAQKEKLRKYRIGKTISQEHKDRISAANKGYIAPESLRAFRSKRMTENNPGKGKFGVNSVNFKGFIAAYKDGALVGIYDGVYDAARQLNNSPTNINRVVTGRGKSSKGLTFKRVENKNAA